MLQIQSHPTSSKHVINPGINFTRTLSKNVGYPMIIQALERYIGTRFLKPLVIETCIANINVQVDIDTRRVTKRCVLRSNVIVQKKHILGAIFLFLTASSMVKSPTTTLKWKL